MKNRPQSTFSQIQNTPLLRPSRHTIRHFLGAMRRHDPSLIEHGKRTAVYSLLLGQALHLASDKLSDICDAALLHDLGKLTLPNKVVHQKGISMIGDYLMTECSPQAGADILRPWPGLQEISKLIALHHERWDGNGEPFGMRGTLIPLGARILSLADTVDQLLTQNNHLISDQISPLIRILRTLSGTRFDPLLVKVFIETLAPSMQKTSLTSLSDPQWSTTLIHFLSRPNSPANLPDISLHLQNISELANPISYDSLQTSLSR